MFAPRRHRRLRGSGLPSPKHSAVCRTKTPYLDSSARKTPAPYLAAPRARPEKDTGGLAPVGLPLCRAVSLRDASCFPPPGCGRSWCSARPCPCRVTAPWSLWTQLTWARGPDTALHREHHQDGIISAHEISGGVSSSPALSSRLKHAAPAHPTCPGGVLCCPRVGWSQAAPGGSSIVP